MYVLRISISSGQMPEGNCNGAQQGVDQSGQGVVSGRNVRSVDPSTYSGEASGDVSDMRGYERQYGIQEKSFQRRFIRSTICPIIFMS